MAKRGRVSAAALETIRPENILQVVNRPEPPYDLTDDQVEVWRKTVAAMSADWFRPETHEALAQYCRHVVEARKIASWLDEMSNAKKVDVVDYDRLLKMQERESRAILATATSLRMTLQSSYDKSKKRKQTQIEQPWASK